MKLYIPSIGDLLRLTEDWEFLLVSEYRQALLGRILDNWQQWADKGTQLMTLEAGTVLRVDRLYIRRGKGEYDSVTFVITESPGDSDRPKKKKFKGARFWAKLEDVNEIEYERAEVPK